MISERLSPDGYPPSWYAATATGAPDLAPLEEACEADICIVGGGYSGLSAALHLARLGRRAVLIEAERLGWGASGRNGGQVHVGMRRDPEWLEERLGADDARALWNLALDGRAHLDWLIDRHAIACDLTPGHLHADHRASDVAHTRAHVDHLRDRYDYPHVRFVGREECRSLVGSTDYHGGMADARGGHLHAMNLALGIARGAVAEGATLYDRTPATAVTRINDRWRIDTPRGSVTADRVILAGNGYLRGLSSPIETRVMPINNFVAVTEPLGPERAAAVVRGGFAVSDSRFVVYYFRITPDHRLLFGGGENYSYHFPQDIAAVVRKHMLRVFPQLHDVPLTHAWGGTLAVTANRLPYVREVEPGLFTTAGYSGLGVVLAPYFGRIVAEAIAGDDAPFRKLAALPVQRFPGGKLMRWPTLVAAMSFLALRDRF